MDDKQGGHGEDPPVHDPTEPTPEGPKQAFPDSQHFFKSLVEHSPDIFSVASADGRFEYFNPAVRSVLGYEPDELFGKQVSDFTHPDDVQAVAATIDWALTHPGQCHSVEHRFRHKNGSWRCLQSEGFSDIRKGGVLRLMATSRDITEQKAAEAALRETEQRYRKTFEQAGLGIAHLSLDGRYIRVNPAFCDMLGYTESELVTKTCPEVTHPDDLKADQETLLRVLRNGPQPSLNEKRFIRKDGKSVWAAITTTLLKDDSRSPLYFIRVAEDIDWRKRAEAELRRNSRRFSLLAWASQELLMDVDPEQAFQQLGYKAMMELNCDFYLSFIAREDQIELRAYAGIDREKAKAIETLEYGQAFCGEVATSGHPIVAEEIRTSLDPRTALLRSWGVRAYACHPLKFQERVLGTLAFGTISRDSFSADELAMMESFANHVSIAMGRRGLERELVEMHRREHEYASDLERRVRERTEELNKANAEIEDRRKVLESLARELTDAEHRERRQLAEMLHDGLQQLLVGTRLSMEAFSFRFQGSTEKQEIDRLCSLVQEAIESCRNLTCDLCPPTLSETGLAPAFQWLASQMMEKYGLEIELDIRGDVEPPNQSAKMLLFSSVRELLFNTVKHSGTKHSRLEMDLMADDIVVRVSDAGAGFEPSRVLADPGKSGFGLFSIRERMALFGGGMRIESAPGRGATFTLLMPQASAGGKPGG